MFVLRDVTSYACCAYDVRINAFGNAESKLSGLEGAPTNGQGWACTHSIHVVTVSQQPAASPAQTNGAVRAGKVGAEECCQQYHHCTTTVATVVAKAVIHATAAAAARLSFVLRHSPDPDDLLRLRLIPRLLTLIYF